MHSVTAFTDFENNNLPNISLFIVYIVHKTTTKTVKMWSQVIIYAKRRAQPEKFQRLFSELLNGYTVYVHIITEKIIQSITFENFSSK